MEDSTLKQLWLEAGQQQKIEINTIKLIDSINQRISVLENHIQKRDTREIIVCILMILLFGWFLFFIPRVLGKIGSAIIIASCFLVIFRLIYAGKTKKTEQSASEIYLHLRVSLQNVRRQITLHDTVLWWYLLPFFIGSICFYYSFKVPLINKGFYTLVVALLYWYIYNLNKKVVSKTLKPLESSILEALEELTEGEK